MIKIHPLKIDPFDITKELSKIRESLGAPLIPWKNNKIYTSKMIPLKEEIILETYEDFKDFFKNIKDEKPLFDKEGECRFVHIPDNTYHINVSDDPTKLTKVHISYCVTLKEMKKQKRFDRYIATKKTDGIFEIDITDKKNQTIKKKVKLNVCKNCLKKYWKYGTYYKFDFKAFAEDFRAPPVFSSLSKTNLGSYYPPNWGQISSDFRNKRGWRCEQCGKDCSSQKSNLHVHHINGVKHDSNDKNLKALCKSCHKKEPKHSHMK